MIITHTPDFLNTQNIAICCCCIGTFRRCCAIERAARQSSETAEALHALRLVEARRAFALLADDDAFDTLTSKIHTLRARLQLLADIAASQPDEDIPCADESPPQRASLTSSAHIQTNNYQTEEAYK